MNNNNNQLLSRRDAKGRFVLSVRRPTPMIIFLFDAITNLSPNIFSN
jgi:hypothetical protein